ncbi:TIGR03943 family putative permease subunit [Actinomadura scrupuli]|uniref:TIGR03943 family putative permease subunit n=1 Tax=Actinomadura scrupuli TaxID=559629 RepID=UPI003D9750A4
MAAVTEEARATTVLLVGALMVRLWAGGAYARYVRVGMGWWLLVAGVLLVALGLTGVVRALWPARRVVPAGRPPGEPASEPAGGPADGPAHRPTRGHDHGHGHEHGHGDRVGWLLLAPVLALLLVTPPALGSYGVDRSAAVRVTSGGRTYDPLPAGGGVVPMSLLEFDERVLDHDGAGFGSTPVRLTGFVARTSDRGGFRIARYQIACCAADAVSAVVRVTGITGTPPARDRWVTVTGTFQRSPDDVAQLHATSLTEVPPPPDPYE